MAEQEKKATGLLVVEFSAIICVFAARPTCDACA
jgi:hypothetical protein